MGITGHLCSCQSLKVQIFFMSIGNSQLNICSRILIEISILSTSFNNTLSWLGLNECFFSIQAISSAGENNACSFSFSLGDNSFLFKIIGHLSTLSQASPNKAFHFSSKALLTPSTTEGLSAKGRLLNIAHWVFHTCPSILATIFGISASPSHSSLLSSHSYPLLGQQHHINTLLSF